MAQAMKVAIVDDEQDMRQSISQWLALSGFETETFPSAEDALRSLGQDYPGVVVSDIKMPDRNGYEVFTAARALHPRTPVILMTGFGYDPHHSIIRASQEGLQTLLFKPFKASQLVDAILKAFEDRKKAASKGRRRSTKTGKKKKRTTSA